MTPQDILKKLQEIQFRNLGMIDCEIQTRKDMNCTQIVFNLCDYGFDNEGKINPKNKSKLYVHRFKWTESNYDNELNLINDEIKFLIDRYE